MKKILFILFLLQSFAVFSQTPLTSQEVAEIPDGGHIETIVYVDNVHAFEVSNGKKYFVNQVPQKDWKKQLFSVQIDPENVAVFPNLLKWQGKCIKINGTLRAKEQDDDDTKSKVIKRTIVLRSMSQVEVLTIDCRK